MKVLVTGSSGLIGSMLINALADKFEISALDARRSEHAPDVPTMITDGSDYESMSKAFEGVDAVVHLAANAPVETPWPDVLKNNISTTHNVYEAARQHGVKRVVFASSNHAVGNFEMDEPYCRIRVGDYEGLKPGGFKRVDNSVPIRPDSDYGVSKAFGEATGRYYHEHFGLEVACLRIGTVNPQNSPAGSVRSLATWLSHRDLTQLVSQCLTQPLGFEIFYGVSDNTWRFWDTDYAKKVIGYAPLDNAEDWR
ncbi:MAG: NAD(P)-dependent oxidoreductase [Chloroflexi bacterium]|nr:NAD(P)-dependent oxidoreductase [Chloroflexota bacterium]